MIMYTHCVQFFSGYLCWLCHFEKNTKGGDGDGEGERDGKLLQIKGKPVTVNKAFVYNLPVAVVGHFNFDAC